MSFPHGGTPGDNEHMRLKRARERSAQFWNLSGRDIAPRVKVRQPPAPPVEPPAPAVLESGVRGNYQAACVPAPQLEKLGFGTGVRGDR